MENQFADPSGKNVTPRVYEKVRLKGGATPVTAYALDGVGMKPA